MAVAQQLWLFSQCQDYRLLPTWLACMWTFTVQTEDLIYVQPALYPFRHLLIPENLNYTLNVSSYLREKH